MLPCVRWSWRCSVFLSLCVRSRRPCPNLQHFARSDLCLGIPGNSQEHTRWNAVGLQRSIYREIRSVWRVIESKIAHFRCTSSHIHCQPPCAQSTLVCLLTYSTPADCPVVSTWCVRSSKLQTKQWNLICKTKRLALCTPLSYINLYTGRFEVLRCRLSLKRVPWT